MSGIKKPKIVALDSNIFIYHFENNPTFSPYTQLVFNQLAQKRYSAVTSIISVIETLSYPAPRKVLKTIEESFQTVPNLTILDIDQIIALKSAQIRREQGFHLPDSIQLATAIYAKADVFITNDERLKRFKQIKIVLLSELTKYL